MSTPNPSWSEDDQGAAVDAPKSDGFRENDTSPHGTDFGLEDDDELDRILHEEEELDRILAEMQIGGEVLFISSLFIWIF